MGDPVPAALLSKVWENIEYYRALGAVLHFETEEDAYTIGVDEIEATRFYQGGESDERGRRCFVRGIEKLWVDKRARDGVVKEVCPALVGPGTGIREIVAAEVIVDE